MTIMIDVGEAGARLAELLAKVEAGDEVLIARHDAPVARITKVAERMEKKGADIERAIEEIKKVRAGIAPTTIEEILAWRDEGRR